MAKYRKIGTDRVNEAWQIGSSEPKPEWTRGWWSKPEELGVENGDYLVHSSKRDYAENASLTSIQAILLMVKRTKFETEWIKVKPTEFARMLDEVRKTPEFKDEQLALADEEIAALKDHVSTIMKGQESLKAQTVRIRNVLTDHPEENIDTEDIARCVRERAESAERDRDALRARLVTWRATLDDANHAIQYLARSESRCECDEDVGQSPCLDCALRQAARDIAWFLASDDVRAPLATVGYDGLLESRRIIANLFRSVFGHNIRDWETYTPKLTAAIASYDLVNEARNGPTHQGAPTMPIKDV